MKIKNRNVAINTFSHVAVTKHVVRKPNRTIWENGATANCLLQLWLMTEALEAHQHSAMLIMLKYLICLSY